MGGMQAHELTANLLEWYAACFCGICFAWYAGALLTPRSRWTPLAAAAGYAGTRLLLPHLLRSDNASTAFTVVRLLIILGVSIVLAEVCFRRRGRLLAYVCVSWAAVFELAFFISYTVVFAGDPLYDSMAERMLSEAAVDQQAFLNDLLGVAYGLQIAMSVVLSFLCWFSCRSIIRSFPMERSELTGPELRLLVLPAVVGLLMGILLRMLVIAVADGVPIFLFDRFPLLKAVVPSVALVAGAAVIYAVRTLRDMVALEAERRRRLVVEGQLQSLRDLVEDTERTNSRVSRMRHDLRNTLTVIQALSENVPEGEALRSYLDDLNGDMRALERPFRTGDPVADTLLATKLQELRDLDPASRLETEDFLLPDLGAVSSYDLGIILGNALDNALGALRAQAGGDRFIRLSSFRHDDLLCLSVENSMQGTLAVRNGLPVSTKAGDGHGLGLLNIRTIAEKYDGAMDWRAADGVFTLTIMLRSPLSAPAESQSAAESPS